MEEPMRTILAIENNRDNLKIVTFALPQVGYSVILESGYCRKQTMRRNRRRDDYLHVRVTWSRL